MEAVKELEERPHVWVPRHLALRVGTNELCNITTLSSKLGATVNTVQSRAHKYNAAMLMLYAANQS